jgi:hypothetical protein
MELKRMHPLLPAVTAAEYGHRAALGLERHGHASGVVLKTVLDREQGRAALHWLRAGEGDEEQVDRHRITEDAAEAIALALVHGTRGWVIRRRLQRGEAADWLLHDPEARPVALEVSGTGAGGATQRLKEKLAQVRGATVASHRAACVVELPVPRATLATAGGYDES